MSDFSSLVGCVLLEDVASSDHHPGRLYPVEGSALLLLHQDLISIMQEVSKAMQCLLHVNCFSYKACCFHWGQRSATHPSSFKGLAWMLKARDTAFKG